MFRVIRHLAESGVSVDVPMPASVDVWSLVLALGAAIAIFRCKVGTIPTFAASCATGIGLHALGLIAATSL